jgi:hypothetical protein
MGTPRLVAARTGKGRPPLDLTGLLDLSGTAPTPVERAALTGLAPG